MVKEFENNWAIVLGGSSGLGLASAKKLARHGMNICIVHRNTRTELENIEKEFDSIRATGVQFLSFNADAANADKQREVVEMLQSKMGKGNLKALVHSIAKGNLKPMTGEQALSNDDFMVTLQSMAVSLYDWAKLVRESGLFADDARIIAFTSEGNARAMRHYGAVSAAKAALEAISRNMALEFAPHGIRSNCIQAGVTDTASLRMIPGSEKIIENAQKRNPFQRLTVPEDVANAVYLLCRPEAAWITGAVIPVNGGENIG